MMQIFSLLEIPDLVRAGSVCSSWHAAYTSLCATAHSKLKQTPCLLYTSESIGDRAMGLYSLAEKKAYTLTVPDPPIQSREVIGSSYGWIITADERSELQLLNPITGDQIALPSVTTIEQVGPIYDDVGTLCEYEYSRHSADCIVGTTATRELASVFSDRSTKSYIVVLIHNPICQLSFTRIGDSEWTWLPPSADYEDCIYIDGVFMKNYIYERMYIVQTPSGDVLQVWREQDIAPRDAEGEGVIDPSEIKTETRKIIVYKVNMAKKELVQIDNLKANHAYLTDNDECIASWKSNCRNIGVFSLGNGSTEEILPPQLWCTWPAPIWITPNLTNLSSGSNDM
ncbi:hypothetical protein HU200_039629 [Digitaria exilis]|uniref:Uncharacterized protein n=1 Tax=Digitaria exilis TaxID=1010633 RepID=A0A835BGG8_9POAL|nr:hypothetical protein HU200_039629 [Digitaria exilis]